MQGYDQREIVRDIRRREKSVAVQIRGCTVTVIRIDIFGLDRWVFAESNLELERVERDVEKVQFVIFHDFPIDDGKKFFRRNERNKHAGRVDGLCNYFVREK